MTFVPLTSEQLQLLRAAPHDVERFSVLADQLQAEGDPRGELILLHVRRGEAPEALALVERERELLATHAGELLGGFAKAQSSAQLTWKLGFIRHATVWTHEAGTRRGTTILLRLVTHLLALESAALLETFFAARRARYFSPGSNRLSRPSRSRQISAVHGSISEPQRLSR